MPVRNPKNLILLNEKIFLIIYQDFSIIHKLKCLNWKTWKTKIILVNKILDKVLLALQLDFDNIN